MISDRDYRALAEFRHQLRRFLKFSEDAAQAAGLEPRQHQCLLALKGLPPGVRPTIGALAERLQLRHHSVVGLVDRLVQAGLVTRQPNVEDRREMLVALTPAAERALGRLSLAHRDELRQAAPALRAALAQLEAGVRRPRRGGPKEEGR